MERFPCNDYFGMCTNNANQKRFLNRPESKNPSFVFIPRDLMNDAFVDESHDVLHVNRIVSYWQINQSQKFILANLQGLINYVNM